MREGREGVRGRKNEGKKKVTSAVILQQDSPNSCGTSWNSTAMAVLSPSERDWETAAPRASPSASLWTLSPRMISQASGLMLAKK